jgi:hypothetical protein
MDLILKIHISQLIEKLLKQKVKDNYKIKYNFKKLLNHFQKSNKH